MSYSAILSGIAYSLFRTGLLAELLVAKAITDAALYVHEGGKQIVESGQAQLAALPGQGEV